MAGTHQAAQGTCDKGTSITSPKNTLPPTPVAQAGTPTVASPRHSGGPQLNPPQVDLGQANNPAKGSGTQVGNPVGKVAPRVAPTLRPLQTAPRGPSYVHTIQPVVRAPRPTFTPPVANRVIQPVGGTHVTDMRPASTAAPAAPILAGLPRSAYRAVLTDPRYGGLGVGFSREVAPPAPAAATAHPVVHIPVPATQPTPPSTVTKTGALLSAVKKEAQSPVFIMAGRPERRKRPESHPVRDTLVPLTTLGMMAGGLTVNHAANTMFSPKDEAMVRQAPGYAQDIIDEPDATRKMDMYVNRMGEASRAKIWGHPVRDAMKTLRSTPFVIPEKYRWNDVVGAVAQIFRIQPTHQHARAQAVGSAKSVERRGIGTK